MAELTITDTRLKPIASKVLAGERLSIDDGIMLADKTLCAGAPRRNFRFPR